MTPFEVAITSLILLYGLLLTLCTLNEYFELGLSKQTTPPDDLTPGVLGCIEKGKVDFELIAADLFYLQNHGYILVESESKSFKIRLLKQADNDLPNYLIQLMNSLFSDDDVFILGKFNQRKFCEIADDLWKSYQKKEAEYYEPSLVIMSLVFFLAGMALVLPCVEVLHRTVYFFERVLIITIGFALFISLKRTNFLRQFSILQYSNRQVVFKLLLLAITCILLLHQYAWDGLNLFLMTLCTFGGLSYFSFTYFHLTRKGKKLFRKLNGYKKFLLHPDPEQAYANLNEIKIDFVYKAPYAFVLAQEFPLINSYSEKSDSLKLAENNYLFFEKHFKAYLRLTHCLESVYYRKLIKNKLLEFSW